MAQNSCGTPDFFNDDFLAEDFQTTPWGFNIFFKSWLFERLPYYFKKNDTYKDANDQGLLERYMSVFGSELDEELIPKITCYLNIIDASVCQSKFLIPLSDSLGNPPDIFQDIDIYRNLLSYVVSIYKIKGTVGSYELFFSILGFNINLVEIPPINEGTLYDNPIIYDDDININLYDDSLCQPCSDYSIEFTAADGNPIEVTPETLEKLRSAIYFTEPINANLISLVGNLVVSDSLSIAVTDNAVETLTVAKRYDSANDYDTVDENYDDGDATPNPFEATTITISHNDLGGGLIFWDLEHTDRPSAGADALDPASELTLLAYNGNGELLQTFNGGFLNIITGAGISTGDIISSSINTNTWISAANVSAIINHWRLVATIKLISGEETYINVPLSIVGSNTFEVNYS